MIRLKKELCIAIPTYNRSVQLRKRLLELTSQLDDRCEVVIFDNCSTDNTQELIQDLLNEQITYRRNSANLGGNANINRCFTETDSEWIWVIGDDDPICSDALGIIFNFLSKYELGIINTNSFACNNPSIKTLLGLDEILANKDVTSLLHLSSNIYHVESVRKHYGILGPSCGTYASQVALILKSCQEGIVPLHLETQFLVKHQDNARRWSGLEVSVGLSYFPQLIPFEYRHQAAVGLRASTRWMLLWGLAEVKDRQSIREWREGVRVANAAFCSRGADIFSLIFSENKSQTKDVIRDAIILVLLYSPDWLIQIYARRQRKQFSEKIDSELENIRKTSD